MKNWIGVCACLWIAVGAYGQGGGNAAITGTVTDPTNASVAGAVVTVTQTGTQVKRTVSTNTSGQFNVPSLPPASYHVSAEARGFKTYAADVTLLADQIAALQIQLQLGQSTETVTVEASTAMVNTVTPVLSQVIEQSRVTELPLNGRNAADLTLLVPGTVNANGHGVQ
jgi:Carboxypeptidase regulatory-like domain